MQTSRAALEAAGVAVALRRQLVLAVVLRLFIKRVCTQNPHPLIITPSSDCDPDDRMADSSVLGEHTGHSKGHQLPPALEGRGVCAPLMIMNSAGSLWSIEHLQFATSFTECQLKKMNLRNI